MNNKYLSILYHLKKLGGRAHVGEITTATGLQAKDINNSLRFVEPRFVKRVGKLESYEWDGRGDPPKILELTDEGSSKADEYDEPEVTKFDQDSIDKMFEKLWAQNTRLERQVTSQQMQIERLKRLIVEDM